LCQIAGGLHIAGRAILPANRSRAAAQFAAGGLPDGQDVMRVWRPRDPAGLRARLGEQPLAVWAEDDDLHVLWQGHGLDPAGPLRDVVMTMRLRIPVWPSSRLSPRNNRHHSCPS
jgi:hypothetical protein